MTRRTIHHAANETRNETPNKIYSKFRPRRPGRLVNALRPLRNTAAQWEALIISGRIAPLVEELYRRESTLAKEKPIELFIQLKIFRSQ